MALRAQRRQLVRLLASPNVSQSQALLMACTQRRSYAHDHGHHHEDEITSARKSGLDLLDVRWANAFPKPISEATQNDTHKIVFDMSTRDYNDRFEQVDQLIQRLDKLVPNIESMSPSEASEQLSNVDMDGIGDESMQQFNALVAFSKFKNAPTAGAALRLFATADVEGLTTARGERVTEDQKLKPVTFYKSFAAAAGVPENQKQLIPNFDYATRMKSLFDSTFERSFFPKDTPQHAIDTFKNWPDNVAPPGVEINRAYIDKKYPLSPGLQNAPGGLFSLVGFPFYTDAKEFRYNRLIYLEEVSRTFWEERLRYYHDGNYYWTGKSSFTGYWAWRVGNYAMGLAYLICIPILITVTIFNQSFLYENIVKGTVFDVKQKPQYARVQRDDSGRYYLGA